jgi:hypothetical protein
LFRSPLARRRSLPSVVLLTALLGTAAVAPAGASAASSPAAAYQRADRSVIVAATRLADCQGESTIPAGACRPLSAALQKAGIKLSRAQRRLPKSATAHAAATATDRRKPPVLTVKGTTLTWRKVADVSTYLLVTKVAGKADHYSVVNGTSTTPPVVSGATVTYNVRTAIAGSLWARGARISYPGADLTSARRAAPVMAVDGTTVRWSKVADVQNYVFVTKVLGLGDRYEYVSGTSFTPPVHPGKTVRYGLSTNVQGAKWASEVTITYPATAAPAPTPPATPAPVPTTGGTTTTTGPTPPSAPGDTSGGSVSPQDFQLGIVSGSAIQWQLGFIQLLNAKHVRMEFDIKTPVSQMEPIIRAYSEAGIQPLLLAGFPGRTPTSAEAQNLASWAAAFGPGGTARAGRNWAANTAVTDIEFGNESNQPYQYPSLASNGNWPASAEYANIATQYALKFKEARTAMGASNPGVGLLAIADTPGRWASWMNGLFAAVPDFGKYVSGWIVHPYGPNSAWQLSIDDAMSQAASHGASNSIPIYVTEYGFATDNGHCVDDNYGWDKCMTYDQAATNLRNAVSAMRSRYAKRLAAVYLYSTSDLAASGTTTNRENYFGALRNDKSPKGAYTSEVKAELTASA